MKRRAFLEAGAAVGLGPLVGSAAASRAGAATARTQGSYEPLGRIPVTGAAEVVVGDGGETAYVAATTGFATVDVSDPAEPTVLAEERDIQVDGAVLSQILDLTVDGDRLVVAGPAEPAFESDDQYLGLRCYDVSDPADPVPIADYETGYHIHNCYLADESLFVVENRPQTTRLVVFDVGGDEFTRVGYWSLLDLEPGWGDIDMFARYLHDVFVQDDIAYLPHWNAGTYLIDVSDPTAPEYVSHVAETTLEEQRGIRTREEAVYGLPGNDHYAAVDDTGDLMAVGREAWATGGPEPDHPGGIDLYDVSDPADPVHRGSIDAPRTSDESYRSGAWTTSHNFELRDDRLYSSWYRAGVKIHDVSDPSAPERLAWWRNPAETGFWTARTVGSGDAFVSTSTEAIPNTSLEGALYTFPTEGGEQADPPPLRDAAEWTTGGNETTENGTVGTPANGTGGASENETTTEETERDDTIPGFTGVAGLAAGGIALEWLRRRGDVQD